MLWLATFSVQEHCEGCSPDDEPRQCHMGRGNGGTVHHEEAGVESPEMNSSIIIYGLMKTLNLSYIAGLGLIC